MKAKLSGDMLRFYCLGCSENHVIRIAPGSWSWNGDTERPTINPSVLVRSGHYASHWQPGDACWCGKGYGYECTRCHTFVRDGRIEYLSDCTHALAGTTVELTDI